MGNTLTIKRISAPQSWKIEKKKFTFIHRPNPGAHSFKLGTSLCMLLRDMLSFATTAKEARYILNQKEVLINGIRRKDEKFLIGFMDTISVPLLNEHYRASLSPKGMLTVVKIDANESSKTLAKVIGKNHVNGKLQINLSNGRNMLVENDSYKLGDSLLVEVPKQNVIDHFSLEKNHTVMLTDGKHIGKIGVVEDLSGDIIIFRVNNEVTRTKKAFAFVIGKENPVITVR